MLIEQNGARFNDYLHDANKKEEILELADALLLGGNAIDTAISDPVVIGLATHLAEAKKKVLAISEPLEIGIVFAMWREVRRLSPASSENPTGEDCLNHKVNSLEWLCKGSRVTWRLYAVDDDCPEGSADMAEKIASTSPFRSRITVLRLREGFPFQSQPLSRLKSLQDSAKGGAILMGLDRAVSDGCNLIGYTDCDNSVHVGQFGLLVDLIHRGANAAFGNRQAQGSTFFWHPHRATSSPGAMLIQHIRRALPIHRIEIVDTAVPFKMFRAEYLKSLLPRLSAFDFSLDIDLVVALAADGVKVARTPYTCVDSFEESTWHHHGGSTVLLQVIRGWLNAVRIHNLPHHLELAALIETYWKSSQQVQTLLDADGPHQMKVISDIDDPRLGSLEYMSTAAISSWLLSIYARTETCAASDTKSNLI